MDREAYMRMALSLAREASLAGEVPVGCVIADETGRLARMVRLVLERGLLDGTRPLPQVVEMVFRAVEERGWQALDETGAPGCGLALPRPLELAACLNRWR